MGCRCALRPTPIQVHMYMSTLRIQPTHVVYMSHIRSGCFVGCSAQRGASGGGLFLKVRVTAGQRSDYIRLYIRT